MSDPAAALRDALRGRYDLREEIGRGGMAAVYAADDTRHGRRVAIKVLTTQESELREGERFSREIRLSASLSHPHIVPVFDSGIAAGRLHFVMPLIEGETLRARLQRETRLEVSTAVQIAREVADALEYAHGRGIVHRDIKPENVLLSHGHSLVADFGIALPSDGAAQGLTGTGLFVGTPDYISPEQLTDGSDVGPAADVYALGCMLFEMLTGTPPFRAATAQATLARRLTGTVPSLCAIRSDIPESLDHAVGRALALDPRDRHSSAAAFSAAMLDALSGARVAVPTLLSLVVRPFSAVGDAAETTEFADGLGEEVIGTLSKLSGLRVMSRSVSARLRGSAQTTAEIGREYGVRYIVSGSVRRSGQRVRVTTDIVDALLDVAVWSERFDGALDDPFDLQEQVARGIVEALHVALSPREDAKLAARPIRDPRVLDIARRANLDIMQFSFEGLQRAQALLQSGIALLGEQVPLLVAMANAEFQIVNGGFEPDPARCRAHRAEASRLLTRALEIDPENADALATLAWISASDADSAGAVRLARRALAAEPNHAFSLSLFGFLCAWFELLDEARDALDRLEAIDPWDMWGAYGRALETFAAGDLRASASHCERLVKIAPTPMASVVAGLTYAWMDNREAAIRIWDSLGDSTSEDLGWQLLRAARDAVRGDGRRALAMVGSWRDNPTVSEDSQWTLFLAEILAIAGEQDAALDMLRHAIDVGLVSWRYTAELSAVWNPQREAPAFQAEMLRLRERRETFLKAIEN
ncbi:protein kinase [Pseudogemmatithrix spongiicola]|uniref:non-specific serine/threonine protein kinase n=1 Tax=Pseudogemmatithrix spongiicola TaxID=3062599 RepID=A0AA49JSX2_9BACT|nr:protein kinase [Gemmatimonadaceae bacterium 'strain 138']WKW14302.1 protein kinase [Gemmatimonadaceae bacterium 'strain 318']